MMKSIIIISHIVVFLICCGESNLSSTNCKEIQKILILNRSLNKYLNDSTLLIDQKSIDEFCLLYNEREKISGYPNVKSSFGFFEIVVTSNKGNRKNIDVIYTVYDGVIIRDFEGDFFKQDKFVDFILRKSNARK